VAAVSIRELVWPALPKMPEPRDYPTPERMPGADQFADLLALTQMHHDRAMHAHEQAQAYFALAKAHSQRTVRLNVVLWAAIGISVSRAVGWL
jgi:hypothetical protein